MLVLMLQELALVTTKRKQQQQPSLGVALSATHACHILCDVTCLCAQDNNAIVREFGSPRSAGEGEKLYNHVDLVTLLDIVNLEAGAAVAGALVGLVLGCVVTGQSAHTPGAAAVWQLDMAGSLIELGALRGSCHVMQ